METREKGTRRKKRTLRSRKRRNMGKRGARRARQRVVVSVVSRRRGAAALVTRDTQLNSNQRGSLAWQSRVTRPGVRRNSRAENIPRHGGQSCDYDL